MTEPRDLDLKLALDALDAGQVPPAAPDWETRVLAGLRAPVASGTQPVFTAQAAAPAGTTLGARSPRARRRLGLRLLVAACLALAVYVLLAAGAGAWVGLPNLPNPLGFTFHRAPRHAPTPLPHSPSASPSASQSAVGPTPAPSATKPAARQTTRPAESVTVPRWWPLDANVAKLGWQRRSSGTTSELTSVDFVGADGWAVGGNGAPGDYGIVAVTTDGGATWKARTSGYHSSLSDVVFVDAKHGWATNENPPYAARLLATSDGGATWQSQLTVKGSLTAIAAVDATHAWAVGSDRSGGCIVATSDGRTWRRQDPGRCNFIADVSFVDPEHGWAIRDKGIITTSDGGATWTPQDSPRNSDLRSLCFVDALHGWAAGIPRVGVAAIAATGDGGATWKSLARQNKGLFARVAFADRLHGWAIASYGPRQYVLATRDGGRHWRTEKVLRTASLDDITVTASGRVCVVGWNGVIYTTSR